MDDPLCSYLDAEGRLVSWPSRRNGRRLQRLALERMAQAFERGRTYTEREANEILRTRHTFGDWAMLRRELVEGGLLGRTSDGSSYWRIANP
ncbi:MAG: DUF2087 domain-containing protein [Fimbriimonadaceae bacterium]|nr:DUF2087 domain-containing protein [Fimbriimonadaceae bacterium]